MNNNEELIAIYRTLSALESVLIKILDLPYDMQVKVGKPYLDMKHALDERKYELDPKYRD